MRSVIFLLCSLLMLSPLTSFGQAPEKIPYQAAVRDASGDLIVSQSVSFQISILQTSSTGTAVYVEEQTVTTNAYGLANLTIGDGTASTGTIAGIDWANGPYYLKIEVDPAGGTSYVDMGATQLLSVPYALHAANAGSGSGYWVQSSDGIYYTDGKVIVGNTTVNNEESGRVAFDEDANDASNTCGFEFWNNGNTNKFYLLSGCPLNDTIFSVSRSSSTVSFYDGVAIGTSSDPNSTLTVEGDADFTGTVDVDGSVDVVGQITVNASAASVPSIRTDYVTGLGKGIQLKNNGASNYWEIYAFSSGRLSFYLGSDEKGNIDETSGAYTAVSDARMKSNVRPLNGVLADVMKLKPSTYNFKQGNTDRDYIGFIAQEVEKVFPQVVHHHADTDGAGIDQYTVDYSGFGVLAISALQEQQKIIEAQEERLATLEAELKALKESLGK